MAFNMLEAMGVFNDAPDIPEIVMLDIDQLHDSDENFYFTQDQQSEKIRIKNEELKASIEMFGVMEPLIVEPIGHDEYNIIAGHRRRLISKIIVSEGKDGYRKIPCIIDVGRVKEDYQSDFNDQVKNALMGLKLIHLNSTIREIDGWQQTEQVRRTKEKLLILKENGVKMPGGMRNQIAVLIGMSRAEVGRHEQIDKNLDDNFKEEYKNGGIVEHTASTLAAMSAEDQKAVYEKTGGKATVKDIKEYKEQKNASEPEEMDNFQLEPELLIVEGTAKPKEIKQEQSTIDQEIAAARYVMDLLMKNIEKCSNLKEIEEKDGNELAAKFESCKVEYLGKVVGRVQQDLFEMTGNDMFRM